MLNECGRIQGGVFALTGVNKDGPEAVGVDSGRRKQLPDLLPCHAYGQPRRPLGRGSRRCNIYRPHQQVFGIAAAPGAPPMPQWETRGRSWPCCRPRSSSARRLNAFKTLSVASKARVRRRCQRRRLRDAVKQRDKPGFFAYADLAALAGRMDEMGKNLGPF